MIMMMIASIKNKCRRRSFFIFLLSSPLTLRQEGMMYAFTMLMISLRQEIWVSHPVLYTLPILLQHFFFVCICLFGPDVGEGETLAKVR